MDPIRLIDDAKLKSGSDNATAKAVGIARQRIDHVRSGHANMSPWLAGRLSEYVGKDAIEAALAIHELNARSGREKADWKRWSGAASVVMGLCAICALGTESATYIAALPFVPLYIMTSGSHCS